MASGANLDLAGFAQTIASLSDGAGGGGQVTNSAAGAAVLTLSPIGGGTSIFSGQIVNGTGGISLVMNGNGTQILDRRQHLQRADHCFGRQLGDQRLAPFHRDRDRSRYRHLERHRQRGQRDGQCRRDNRPGIPRRRHPDGHSVVLNSGAGLAYALGTGGTDSLLNVTGNLMLSPNIGLTIIPNSGWGNGNYTLASFGSLTDNSIGFSGWAAAITGTGLGAHNYGFSISGNTVDLSVTNAANGVWTGLGNGQYASWDDPTKWQGGNIPGLGLVRRPSSAKASAAPSST